MKNNSNNQSGYTLIEVIIAIQIFLIVLTMTYTIYLFGYKYIVRWNNDNDLLATELLIQKSLSNELATAKKIIEISEHDILYIDHNYNLQKIYWTNDSLFIKSKPLNKPGVKTDFQKMEFMQNENNLIKSFAETDINKDNKISNSELEKISSLKIEYLLSNKNKKFHSQLELYISSNSIK